MIGENNCKWGKNEADDEKRELVFKEDGQEYAQVQRMLGNDICEATCVESVKRLCHIHGKMHKRSGVLSGLTKSLNLDCVARSEPHKLMYLKITFDLFDNLLGIKNLSLLEEIHQYLMQMNAQI